MLNNHCVVNSTEYRNYRLSQKSKEADKEYYDANRAKYYIFNSMSGLADDLEYEERYELSPDVLYDEEQLMQYKNYANLIWCWVIDKHAGNEVFTGRSLDFTGGVSQDRVARVRKMLSFDVQCKELTGGAYGTIAGEVDMYLIPKMQKILTRINRSSKSKYYIATFSMLAGLFVLCVLLPLILVLCEIYCSWISISLLCLFVIILMGLLVGIVKIVKPQ